MEFLLTPQEIIIRILVSAFIGFVIGLNRERYSSAGVRTHMILSVGVCIITLIQVDMTTESIIWYMENPEYIGVAGTDTTRLTAQIVSGIGFLGSGLILVRNDRTVDGMTSAVSLWTVAGISIGVGYGEYLISLLGGGLLIGILTILNSKATRYNILSLKVYFKDFEPERSEINNILKSYNGKIINYTKEKIITENGKEYRYIYEIEYKGFIDKIDFLDRFSESFKDISYIKLV
ncbi:MgtC/SapB family protein [uncultured Anaerococcus sp.]|uniref:MgtC/SapB family protein n=1 Tax=uncultured Anaerococcus sp. TaxID=293428 RepID=UPI0025F62031|nr:MgtC/SapB family protein [uncultured Anaerococcus sp.]